MTTPLHSVRRRPIAVRLIASMAFLFLMYGCGRIGFIPIPLDGDLLSTPDGSTCPTACDNPHGSADCSAGTCALVCASGYADCNLDPGDGCEADLSSGVTGHCGTCGTRCEVDEMCVSGTCESSNCPAGFAECDADTTVMCETDLASTLEHCGACASACSLDHATPDCVGGTCVVLRCDVGFDDCDGDPANGCETELATDVDHCGACHDACRNDHGSTTCAESSCVPSCEADYADCDGSTRNGCERPLETGCSLCGVACPDDTPGACTGDTCDPECDLTGTWALKLHTTLSWAETRYVAGDVDQPFEMSLRVEITQSDGEVDLQLTECERVVPEFEAKFPNERSLLSYPHGLFDAHGVPSVSTVAALRDISPGSPFFAPAVAAQLGISLTDAVNDPWPSDQADITAANRVDMDGDGKDGVTATYTNTSPYFYPRTTPIIALGAPRSDSVYVAARAVFSLAGTLTSCTESSGSAGFSRIDTRLYGCTIANTAWECDPSQTDRIDDSVMHYQPQPGTYTLRKVADDADCMAIRAAPP